MLSTEYINQITSQLGKIITNSNLIANPIKHFKKINNRIKKLINEEKLYIKKFGKEANVKLNNLYKNTIFNGIESINMINKKLLTLKGYYFIY